MILRLDPDDSVTVVTDDLDFPNGMVVTPGRRHADRRGVDLPQADAPMTSGPTAALSGRQVFADGLDGPPDGIALDAEGAVWTSTTLAHQFQRVSAGGAVTARIDIGDRAAIACMLGRPDRRTLFLLSSSDAYPAKLVGTRSSRVETVRVDVPGAGFPSIGG